MRHRKTLAKIAQKLAAVDLGGTFVTEPNRSSEYNANAYETLAKYGNTHDAKTLKNGVDALNRQLASLKKAGTPIEERRKLAEDGYRELTKQYWKAVGRKGAEIDTQLAEANEKWTQERYKPTNAARLGLVAGHATSRCRTSNSRARQPTTPRSPTAGNRSRCDPSPRN